MKDNKVKIIGTYQIINTLDQKSYVGSSNNIAKRWSHHKTDLNNGALGKVNSKGKKMKHHCKPLQRAWIKYGADAFQFNILERNDTAEEALQDEQLLLNVLWDGGKTCYNTAKEATAGMKGRKHTEDSKRKMATGSKDRIVSPETREKLSTAGKGRKHTKDSKDKMSAAQKGRVWTQDQKDAASAAKNNPETRAKISAAQKGKKRKPHSAETIAKISAANTGKKRSPETCAKMSERVYSKEHREACSRGQKLRFQNNEISEETHKKLSESITKSWIKRKQDSLLFIEKE